MSQSASSAIERPNNVVGLHEEEVDENPLIPEGEYRLKLLSHSTAMQFDTPRLILSFHVLDFGSTYGTTLKAFFNVQKLKGKAGKNGRVHHKRTGDFMVQYYTLLPETVRIKRLDRVPLLPLYNNVIVGKVSTVRVNSKKVPLPEQLWYSKVAQLLRIEN